MRQWTCLSALLSIKHDPVCQVIFDKPGRTAPDKTTMTGIKEAGAKN